MLCHFGTFDRLHLPGAWSSTANQLERRAFLLKDTPFLVDDWAPSALESPSRAPLSTPDLRRAGRRAAGPAAVQYRQRPGS